jgi:hypothetical protein
MFASAQGGVGEPSGSTAGANPSPPRENREGNTALLSPHDPPEIPRAEARQHVIADRARPRGEIVERDIRAEELRSDAGPRCVFGQIGHVGDAEVHRHAPDQLAAMAGDGDFRACATVDRAGAAWQPVGIAGEQRREPGAPSRGPLLVPARSSGSAESRPPA